MGGLVARYYIENCTELTHYETGKHNTTCKYGDLHVSKLITIDTPHWGSDLADLSSFWGIKHELCDHDLEVESAMFGGNIGDKITCKAAFDKCDAQNYKVTDELNYDRYRHTKYYAIAGIDYNATDVNNNNQAVAILEDLATYEALENYVHSETNYMMYESNVNSVVGTKSYMSLSAVDDNVVEFYSQIGWYGESTEDSPSKKVSMYKIFINIDSDGNDFTNSLISHFHSKMPHRQIVIEQIGEYLGENIW